MEMFLWNVGNHLQDYIALYHKDHVTDNNEYGETNIHSASQENLYFSIPFAFLESSIVIFSVLANHLNNTTTIKWDMCITL
jgi:hypothetical protein